MTLITMSVKELDRFQIIKKLIGKHVNGTAAADLLRLTVRQVRRLKANVIKFGAKGLIHGNRGKESHNKIDDNEKKKIIELLNKHYPDFKPTFANEKLFENHGIDHDTKTIRQIMINKGLWKPRLNKKASAYRAWRERRSCYGEMIQFDGSYEHWLENRGGTGEICLLAAIDDATSQIILAKFASHEGVFPVFGFWQSYLMAQGKPRTIYLDKFSTYNQNQTQARENSDTLTQFQRAMEELRIEVIPANSPQAKGRVERLFGTLQDRLIKELRLANISTVEQANIFLEKTFIPKFNARFSVEPKNKTNLHQKLTMKELNGLPRIFSRQTKRTVLNDFTFSFKNQWYQLTKEQPATVCKKDKVIVEEHLDSAVFIRLRGKCLNYQLLPQRPKRENQLMWVLAATQIQPADNLVKARQPASNHPWRQAFHLTAQANLQRTIIPKVGHFNFPETRTF